MCKTIRPLTHLADTSVASFLHQDWQRRPRLFRKVFAPGFCALSRDMLFELAGHQDAESRLVTHFNRRWRLQHGPLEQTRLPLRRRSNWTLLVQGVNLFVPEIDALMQRFRFIADARLDDVMASYATDGGGVGPHTDSYDVFLLQATGRRRWRISRQRDTTPAPNVPLKQLARFVPTHEWTLEPGDMLYLPPGVAHEGTAIGDCITLSIGFRTPTWSQLAESWFDHVAPRVATVPEYQDRRPRTSRQPAQLPTKLITAMQTAIERLRPRRLDAEHALLAWLTEPKPNAIFSPPARSLSLAQFRRRLAQSMLVTDLRTRLLYRGRRIAINGEVLTPAQPALRVLRQLADERVLDGGRIKLNHAATASLYDAYQAGWLHLQPK